MADDSQQAVIDALRKRGRVGGPRPGSGRPRGSKNSRPRVLRPPGERYAELLAAKAWRVPSDAPHEAALLAGYALTRITDVVAGRVGHRLAPSVLRAALALRDSICPPVSQQINLDASFSLEQLVARAGLCHRQEDAPALPEAIEL